MNNDLQTTKLSELPEAIALNESDYSLIVQNGTSKKIKSLLLKGNTGDKGKSIEIQKTDTHIQWRQEGGQWINLVALTDLKGDKGEQGLQGIKGDKGDKGEQGLQGIKGDTGANGKDGTNAINPTFTIGTVTTLPSGSDTTVTLTGTYPNLVLNFGIPKGADGSGGGGSGEGLTPEQTQQLQTAYDHSQSPHVQQSNIPSKTSDLTNDSGFLTSIPSEYVTEEEMSTALSNKANISHTHTEYASIDHIHNYNDLTNKPTIPSKTSDLTNDSGFLTSIPSEYVTEAEMNTALSNKANKSDNSLNTSSKTIVGAINEIKTSVDGIDVSGLQSKTDNSLNTTDKTIVGAINETFQSVSNGKTLIASAITDKGISTSNTDTFETMANNIASITTGSGSTEIKYVESIALDKNTATINLGETEQLTATLTPTDATIQDILWKSSNETIATVNNGLISTLALGNANITATSREGYLSAICSIVIVDPYSGSYVTDESGNRLMAENGSYLITD